MYLWQLRRIKRRQKAQAQKKPQKNLTIIRLVVQKLCLLNPRKKNKKKLIELAEVLLTKEVIFKDNLEEIFGKRPFDKQELANKKKK